MNFAIFIICVATFAFWLMKRKDGGLNKRVGYNTFTKLKNGQWGVHIVTNEKVEVGKYFGIMTKTGKISYVEIAKVLTKSGNHYLCSIVKTWDAN